MIQLSHRINLIEVFCDAWTYIEDHYKNRAMSIEIKENINIYFSWKVFDSCLAYGLWFHIMCRRNVGRSELLQDHFWADIVDTPPYVAYEYICEAIRRLF